MLTIEKIKIIRVYEAIKLASTCLTASPSDPLGTEVRNLLPGHIMQLTRQGYILGKGYLLAEKNTYVVIGGANVDINGPTVAAGIPLIGF